MDFIYLGGILLLFGLTVGLAYCCANLGGSK